MPRLSQLPAGAWRDRHTAVLSSLLVLFPIVVGLVIANSVPVDLATTYFLTVGFLVILAASPKFPVAMRQVFGAAAVLTATVTLVEASSRALPSHLVFACTLVLVALYQSWVVQVFAYSYLAFYYFVLSSASPDLVFPDGTERVDAILYSAVLFSTAVAASIPAIVAWYLSSRTANEAETLRLALAQASVREQQASELNDTVVQDLVTAIYAYDEDDDESAVAATRRALNSARRIVASLVSPEKDPAPGGLVRGIPAQEGAAHSVNDEEGAGNGE